MTLLQSEVSQYLILLLYSEMEKIQPDFCVVIGVKCNKPNPEKMDFSNAVFSADDKLDIVPPSVMSRSMLSNNAGVNRSILI